MAQKVSPIIVALDGMTKEGGIEVARELSGRVWGFKVNDLLLDCGLDIVRQLSSYGKVFADPKLHDIPNTVHNAVKKLAHAGADLITVHASGGRDMLKAAAEATSGATKILAVTVLTSLGEEDVSFLYHRHVRETVLAFAHSAIDAGVQGVVCSAKELTMLMDDDACEALLKVVPGIRPKTYGAQDDQARTLGPGAALRGGADLLVIGRPITGAPNRIKALEDIVEEIHSTET